MANTTFSWKNYWKPTPAKIRQWADAIMIALSTIGTLVEAHGKAFIIAGIILKLLSNFFKDENTEYIKIKSDPDTDTSSVTRM